MLNNRFTTLKERLTCFIAHDMTKLKTEKILFGHQKSQHCKRPHCNAEIVSYL